MSKQHFELLAERLKANKPTTNQPDFGTALAQWQQDVGVVATVCSDFNPKFDRKRFVEACGL